MTGPALDPVVPDHVLSAHLAGETVLLDLDTKRYYRLNETGQVVWRGLEEDAGRDEILERLLETYEVDAETAGREVDRFLAALGDRRLVRVEEPR